MSGRGVWIAGSYQSDYARNYAREGLGISDMVAEAVTGTLDHAKTNPEDVEATHDCFSMSEYMAIDHFGITGPGESWKAVENGDLERDGAIPVNPGGGLTTTVSFVVTRED